MAIVTRINEVDENRRSALHHAAILGDLPLVEFLIDNGARLNIKDKDRWIPLDYAEQIATDQQSVSHMKITSLLLEKMYDVNGRDTRRWRPILWSIMAGDKQRVIELRDRGADIFLTEQNAVWAAEYLQDDEILKILAEGAPDWYFFKAMNDGHRKFMQAIIEQGPSIAIIARAGLINKMQKLIDNGTKIDTNALFMAICSGNPDLVEIILKHNVELASELMSDLVHSKIDIPSHYNLQKSPVIGDVLTASNTNEGTQKIHQMITKAVNENIASLPAFATIAKLQHLKEQIADEKFYWKKNLFYIAGKEGLDQELRELLVHADATTRMRWAVHLGDLELLKQALADGADIDHRFGRQRWKVLNEVVWLIAYRQRQDLRQMMAFLLANGADTEVVGYGSMSKPIQDMIRKKDFEGVKMLLDYGADPNAGRLTATYVGDHQIIEMLIAYGADVNNN